MTEITSAVRPVPHDLATMTTEVASALRFFGNFFDSRGMEAATEFAHESLTTLDILVRHNNPENAWTTIRAEFYHTLSDLRYAVPGLASKRFGELFEKAQREMAITGYEVLFEAWYPEDK